MFVCTKSVAASSFSAAFLSFGLLAASVPAAAQDTPWDGLYAGVNGGVTWSDSQANVVFSLSGNPGGGAVPIPPGDITAINAGTHFDSNHHTGFTGGFEAGYNYVMDGGFMLGIETDLDIYDMKGERSRTFQGLQPSPPVNPPIAPITYNVTQSVDTDFLWTLRPRIGYATKSFLVFVSGGLAVTSTKYEVVYSDNRTPAGKLNPKLDESKTGWTIGGGGAFALTEKISLKGEYLFNDFGTSDLAGASSDGYLKAVGQVHLKSHMFRVGLDYHF